MPASKGVPQGRRHSFAVPSGRDPRVAGIVSDTPFHGCAGRPVIDIDDVEGVVELVLAKAERLDAVLARLRAEAVGEA